LGFLTLDFMHHLDQQPSVLTKLGASTSGQTATFTDGSSYELYIVAIRSQILIDSVYGPGGSYLDDINNIMVMSYSAFDDGFWWDTEVVSYPVLGAPDGTYAAAGQVGALGRFTGCMVVVPPENWTELTVVTVDSPYVRHDWNGDGIRSIVGDVPPFVQCVYFNNCPAWSDERRLSVGDCNHDGIISIVGDVPCFVQCVYFGNCDE
jgi:hypothetical protein